MAVTVTDVATPNYTATNGLNQFKWVLKDVTFDSSYPTTGEIITAAKLNLSVVLGGLPGLAANAAGTLAMPVYVEPTATGTQVTLQVFRYDGAAAGKASLEEAAAAFDASTFIARIWFFGH